MHQSIRAMPLSMCTVTTQWATFYRMQPAHPVVHSRSNTTRATNQSAAEHPRAFWAVEAVGAAQLVQVLLTSRSSRIDRRKTHGVTGHCHTSHYHRCSTGSAGRHARSHTCAPSNSARTAPLWLYQDWLECRCGKMEFTEASSESNACTKTSTVPNSKTRANRL